MTINTQKTIGYVMAAILLVVGLICYTAFAKKAPEEPLRIMFKTPGGNVLFSHKTHFSDTGYGFECTTCHHMFEDEGGKPLSCGECHLAEGDDAPKLSDALHEQCIGCHKDSGSGPVECYACHMR